MSGTIVYSIIESPAHPDFSTVFRALSLEEKRFASMRKAIAALKRDPPTFVVAEFFYGWGNNYAGVNVSNLDVFLYSLQKYAPQARVIVLVSRAEAEHVEKLCDLFQIHAVLQQPVSPAQIEEALSG
jgi:hypothetical protein